MADSLWGLSKIEYEFMTWFWEQPLPVDFSKVVGHVQHMGHQWAKTTIHTHLTNLIKKEVLTYRLQGRRKLYYAKLSEKKLQQRYAERFLNDAFDGSLKKFITALTYKKEISKAEADDLKDFMDKTFGD